MVFVCTKSLFSVSGRTRHAAVIPDWLAWTIELSDRKGKTLLYSPSTCILSLLLVRGPQNGIQVNSEELKSAWTSVVAPAIAECLPDERGRRAA